MIQFPKTPSLIWLLGSPSFINSVDVVILIFEGKEWLQTDPTSWRPAPINILENIERIYQMVYDR